MRLDYKHILTRVLWVVLFASTHFSCSQQLTVKADIVPLPHGMQQRQGNFEISPSTKIVVSGSELLPLANLFNKQLKKLSGFELDIVSEESNGKNIHFIVEERYEEEEYQLEISNDIRLKASNYNGLTLALSSLVQLISVIDNTSFLPKVDISDRPDYEYRAVMLDLARRWHPVETIQEAIDLLWLYKVKYLVLHLSDNRRVAFPLEDFPKLQALNPNGSRAYYTLEELNGMVEYAKQRGIAIIPEIDLPGHSTQLWSQYPETFGSIDPKTGKAKALYVVNMAKEETYAACKKIIEQLAKVFYTSPYIHLGGDEVYLEAIKQIPEYKDYCKKHDLQAALDGNANELFCHFINRMHKTIKETGKQTLVWEGFHGTGAGKETISKDIKVIVWNATYNTPQNLVSNGYDVINSTWIPWYMVGAMNLAPTPEKGYDWNVTDWSHWDDTIDDITIAHSPSIKGGQLSFWEQNYYTVIPVLRERLPVLSERLWNNRSLTTYEEFEQRSVAKDSLYSQLFRPVSISHENLLQKRDLTFDNTIRVRLDPLTTGEIRYSYSNDWGIPDMDKASVYREPMLLNESGVFTAQLYDKTGEKVGFPIQEYYQKIEPIYTYKVFGPAPNKGWDTMPDFSKLAVVREGVSGKMTPQRLDKINGELFAKVKKEGHIETRFNGLYNQYALELRGSLSTDENLYAIKIQTDDGLAELYINDTLVAKGEEFENKPEEFVVGFKKGTHNFRINYYYKHIQNQLSILYKTPEMKEFVSFEDLIEPLK